MCAKCSASLLIFLLTLQIAIAAQSAAAKTIDVPAGTGTLQTAIDAASPGDQLRLEGVYKGAIVINKSLKIYCKKNRTILDCQIDADCAAPVAVEITADGVSLGKRNNWMVIYRATSTNVLVSNSTNVKLNAIENWPTFGTILPATCAATWPTGFEIDASVKVKMRQMAGFPLYVHDIPLGGPVWIAGSFRTSSTAYSEAAIVIEDSGIGATELGKGGIRLRKNIATAYTDHVAPSEMGVSLINSHGINSKYLTLSDREIGEGPGGGAVGISLDASSDKNLFVNQYVMDFLEFGDPSYVDNGTGNCLKKFDKGNFVGPTAPDSCP